MIESHPAAEAPDSTSSASKLRSRRAVPLITAAAVVLLGGGATAWALTRGGSDDSFAVTRPRATYTGFAVSQQSPDFYIGVDLTHPGSSIEILDVAAHTGPNVEFLGAVTVWPRQIKGVSVGAGLGYPPIGDVLGTHPLGELIPAAETLFEPKGFTAPGPVTVVAGFRLRSGEIGAMNGIRVVYKVDGRTTTKDSAQAGIACLKPKCGGGPTGSDSPDFDTRILRDAGLLPKD